MKLEIERLRLDISAPERDKALSSIGIDPATINPNALLEESHMVSLSKTANSLALLGQAFSEDRTTSVIGLDPVHDEIDIDFWNINRIGEECCGDPCQVRVEPSTLTSSSQSIFSCSACQRKACRVCCAGKGAILLVRNQSGGTGPGGDSSSNRSVTMDGVICKLCCQQSVLDALTLDYIRVLISQRRSIHIETASFDALAQVVGKNYFSRKKESPDNNHADAETHRELLNEEESLAEFPFGSFLHSVESASGSAPALSLLAPLDTGSRQSYWKAPPSTSSVEFIIVLGNHSDVSGVVLLVSPCGYSMSDSPTVQIWTSQKIHKEERSCVGKWDVRSLITSSPELSGPEKPGNTPRHIKFPFQNRVRCRLIWINLSIQTADSNSSSVSFEKDSNLLSLDEDPSSSDDLGRRAPIAGTSETDPCLHAKRIIVVGYSVKADIADSSSQNAERASSLKNWLEKPPLMNRYRVQVDSEKLIENDSVLEQLISQGSPMVAGFRLDGFSAIKPRVTHSPYPNINSLDASSIVFEHRFISPPVLHIQVSALQKVNDCSDNVCYQGSSEEMVVVGEFRIPEVKGGTTMYFDLPKAISGRKIWFRVVGDIAGFADDPEEGEAGRPVAAGLSLLNRIKLYYYAHPNDLGRWASLSGI